MAHAKPARSYNFVMLTYLVPLFIFNKRNKDKKKGTRTKSVKITDIFKGQLQSMVKVDEDNGELINK